MKKRGQMFNVKCRAIQLGSLAVLLSASAGFAQTSSGSIPPTKPMLGQGEVIADDVYVRSGASLNHYPVCKLNAGTRVTVVSDSGDWYEILPPAGVFSYISGDFVDAPDGQLGVVNGNNVRIRAGSNLTEFAKLKYVVQTKLSKGARVHIVSQLPDGFMKIVPPQGTTVWINRDFVEMVPQSLLDLEKQSITSAIPGTSSQPTAVANSTGGSTSIPATTPANPSSGQQGSSALSQLPTSLDRAKLIELDALASVEIAKPVLERQFTKVITQYQTFATQTKDDFSRRYAQARVSQLSDMESVVATVRAMRRMNDRAQSKRRTYLEGRANIGEKRPPIPTELDAQGELRTSALYPPGTLPRRYRLVNTSRGVERTIGYVEIPTGSTLDVDAFLGRYVGIRAKAKRLQVGGVNPVPIFVVGDMVILQRNDSLPTPVRQDDSAGK